jgi:hypothetical protein
MRAVVLGLLPSSSLTTPRQTTIFYEPIAQSNILHLRLHLHLHLRARVLYMGSLQDMTCPPPWAVPQRPARLGHLFGHGRRLSSRLISCWRAAMQCVDQGPKSPPRSSAANVFKQAFFYFLSRPINNTQHPKPPRCLSQVSMGLHRGRTVVQWTSGFLGLMHQAYYVHYVSPQPERHCDTLESLPAVLGLGEGRVVRPGTCGRDRMQHEVCGLSSHDQPRNVMGLASRTICSCRWMLLVLLLVRTSKTRWRPQQQTLRGRRKVALAYVNMDLRTGQDPRSPLCPRGCGILITPFEITAPTLVAVLLSCCH